MRFNVLNVTFLSACTLCLCANKSRIRFQAKIDSQGHIAKYTANKHVFVLNPPHSRSFESWLNKGALQRCKAALCNKRVTVTLNLANFKSHETESNLSFLSNVLTTKPHNRHTSVEGWRDDQVGRTNNKLHMLRSNPRPA
jgi:hypothetical protein